MTCSFCNIKLLITMVLGMNKLTVDLTGGFHVLGKMNTLEWSDLVTYSVYLSKIYPKYCHSLSGS